MAAAPVIKQGGLSTDRLSGIKLTEGKVSVGLAYV
ncbi:MAG: hypothetical protein BRC47_11795 [Cyanobacteria bacterium QS_7_48_42]|nr:MAG: hypothetical protein BRC47_11795 [Cyanobacteria bacterium QS_7_48_42]PSP28848.1 MAG: hypothetical protein BRC59_11060 [Cyanobacteria bacterium SW_4_48_29]